jgi:hypothetical protein
MEKDQLLEAVAKKIDKVEVDFLSKRDDRAIHDALLEHVGRRLQRELRGYDGMNIRIRGEIETLERQLSSEAETRLCQALGYGAKAVGLARSVVTCILLKARGEPELTKSWRYDLGGGSESGTFVVTWGNGFRYNLLDGLRDGNELEKVREFHQTLCDQAMEGSGAKELALLVSERAKLVKKLLDELDMLRLKRILPGRCRFCPG